MTLTLQRMSAGLAILFAILVSSILLVGNQRLAHADVPPDLGSQIVCRVFTDLNHIGPPIPLFPGDCHNPPGSTPQCSDGIDNDGDGLQDYPADSGCTSEDDNTEAPNPPAPACSNNIDDDDDGLQDFPADPGCASSLDTDESNTPPLGAENTLALCSDGIDNDADALIDLADPDCSGFAARLVVVKIVINDNNGTSTVSNFSLHIATTSTGFAETIGVSSGATTTVSSGTWTVGELQKSGYTATFGGDCNSSGQVTLSAGETKTCTITNNDIAPEAPACADGIDNDGDSLIDSADPGCSDSSDNDESNIVPTGGSNPPSPSGGSGGDRGGGISGPVITAIFTATATSTGSVLGVATDAPHVAATESCDKYLTSFIKSGVQNDASQVRRLQYVLRDFEGGKVSVNGTYDAATLVAVHAFQAKYASEVLAPWGIGKSTGFVYLTTRKKVNEVYCRSTKQFPLTNAEQQTIEKTRSTAQPSVPVIKKPVSAPSSEKAGVPPETLQTTPATEAVQETKKSLWSRLLDIMTRGADN